MAALCLLPTGVECERMSAQYCHSETPQAPVRFCLAANTRHNVSTQTTDLAITFGHERSPRGGWAAVGIGEGMYGALMFVTYAGTSKDGKGSLRGYLCINKAETKAKHKDLVLSVRTGK
jgi:hypothetical protein